MGTSPQVNIVAVTQPLPNLVPRALVVTTTVTEVTTRVARVPAKVFTRQNNSGYFECVVQESW